MLFPQSHKKLNRAAVSFETATRFLNGRRGSGDHLECLSLGTILAWGSNDHGQMADGDWTKAEVADGEDEKDVVITESDQFVFPAVIMVPAES